jgi:hypothetical protein
MEKLVKSDVLSEGLRWMSEPELPKAAALRELIVESVLACELEDGPHGSEVTTLVMGLVAAYDGALDYQDEQREDAGCNVAERIYLERSEAERYLRKCYVSAEIISVDFHEDNEVTREHVGDGFCWPDALYWERGRGYHKRLLRELGIALGYLAGRRTKALRAWYLAEQAKKTG